MDGGGGGGDCFLFLANAMINTTIYYTSQEAVHQAKGMSHLAKPIYKHIQFLGGEDFL